MGKMCVHYFDCTGNEIEILRQGPRKVGGYWITMKRVTRLTFINFPSLEFLLPSLILRNSCFSPTDRYSAQIFFSKSCQSACQQSWNLKCPIIGGDQKISQQLLLDYEQELGENPLAGIRKWPYERKLLFNGILFPLFWAGLSKKTWNFSVGFEIWDLLTICLKLLGFTCQDDMLNDVSFSNWNSRYKDAL